jgi:hypothetical protein
MKVESKSLSKSNKQIMKRKTLSGNLLPFQKPPHSAFFEPKLTKQWNGNALGKPMETPSARVSLPFVEEEPENFMKKDGGGEDLSFQHEIDMVSEELEKCSVDGELDVVSTFSKRKLMNPKTFSRVKVDDEEEETPSAVATLDGSFGSNFKESSFPVNIENNSSPSVSETSKRKSFSGMPFPTKDSPISLEEQRSEPQEHVFRQVPEARDQSSQYSEEKVQQAIDFHEEVNFTENSGLVPSTANLFRRITRRNSMTLFNKNQPVEDIPMKKSLRVSSVPQGMKASSITTTDLQDLLISLKTTYSSVFKTNYEKYEKLLEEIQLKNIQLTSSKKGNDDPEPDEEIPLILVDLTGGIESIESQILKKYFYQHLYERTDKRKEITSRLSSLLNEKDLATASAADPTKKVPSSKEWILKSCTETILRINYSSERILQSIEKGNIYWKNILVTKGFRSKETAVYDDVILSHYFQSYQKFCYSIAEHPDDSLSKTYKNRMMLTTEDTAIQQTPIFYEIYYSILLALHEVSSRHRDEKDNIDKNSSNASEETKNDPASTSSANIYHQIENFAFLYSLKNGFEQKPHIDFHYNLKEMMQLGDDFFFHQDMSYSFLYCLKDGTILHYINHQLDNTKITIHLNQGDLIIWSGQQIHFGGKYVDKYNLRVFGNIRALNFVKRDNEFYWYNKDTKGITVINTKENKKKKIAKKNGNSHSNRSNWKNSTNRNYGRRNSTGNKE